MASNTPKKTHERRERWWVVHQHHEVTVVQGEERPDTAVEDGERIKRAYGPYYTKEEAKDQADAIYSRTTKAMAERAGV
jgi:hypothetical protein